MIKLGNIFSLAVYLQLADQADLIYLKVLGRFDLNRVPCETIYSTLLTATQYMTSKAKL